jgi:thiosulfate/3-mercaptopyruvate sulfurtransferase
MTSTSFARHLVSTEWLADNLNASDIRVLDCTTHLRPDAPNPYRVESGEADYLAGHIPGAVHIDLQGELSDPDAKLRFMLPSAEQFASAMGAKGVGVGTRVVLYSTTTPQWATRIWWMLRAFGFDDAMVLDGGFKKWKAEGREVSTAPGAYAAASFNAQPRPHLFANKDGVLAALADAKSTVLNALSIEHHSGAEPRHYGRPGRIAESVNVPANGLLNLDTGAYRTEDELRDAFETAGVDLNASEHKIVHYCGGGIAASSTAFIMTLLGHENVSVYDASLSEWANDASLPMQTG